MKASHVWVVDADLQSYFDTIPHDALLAKAGKRIADGCVLGLVEQFLKQDILDDMKRWTAYRRSWGAQKFARQSIWQPPMTSIVCRVCLIFWI